MEENSGAAAGGINGDLPVDLLRQILLRLPVKSLCRFQCVSKLCSSVISDPFFVEAHRAFSGDRPELLIAFQWQSISSQDVFHPFRPKQTAILNHSEMYSTPYPFRRSADRTVQTLAPSCRSSISVQRPMSHQVGGLYCIDSGESVRICNPATREFFDVETVFNPFLMKRIESNAFWVRITNHFGFDPVERKHKVISIWWRPYLECYVFVLEDNYWTKILDNYPREFSAPGINEVICVGGVVFSATYSSLRCRQILVAFDVRSETFRVIEQLPDPQCRSQRRLIEFAGRVAMLSRDLLAHRHEHSKAITLWVLEDLEQQAVWRRKDCVIPLEGEYRNLEGLSIQGGTPAGDLILSPTSFKDDQYFFLMYNVESNAIRRIDLQGIPRGPSNPRRCIKFLQYHVESLQSPKAKNP